MLKEGGCEATVSYQDIEGTTMFEEVDEILERNL